MMLPTISEREFCDHIEDEDFALRYGNPVCICADDNRKYVCMTIELYDRLMKGTDHCEEDDVKAWWTSDGLFVQMPAHLRAELRNILMEHYGITVEEALTQYIHWIAEKPDEFRKWIEEIRENEKTGEYTAHLADRADRRR